MFNGLRLMAAGGILCYQQAGEYASTSEALRDAVRVWQRQRSEHAAERLAAIRTRVRRALDDPRPSVPLDEAFDRIEKLHADTVKARGDAPT